LRRGHDIPADHVSESGSNPIVASIDQSPGAKRVATGEKIPISYWN
jgi:hypothetical protein